MLYTLRAELYVPEYWRTIKRVYHESEKKYIGESDDKERKIHASAEG